MLNMAGKNLESPALEALAEVVADGACWLHLDCNLHGFRTAS